MKTLTFCFTIILFSNVLTSFGQNYFKPQGDFTSAMNINLLKIDVNGINMEAGDEIGIFDNDICVGTAVLDNSLEELYDAVTKSAVAGADDAETQEIDGFTTGDTLNFKIWDSSEKQLISNIYAKYYNPRNGDEVSAPKFEIGATVYVALSAEFSYKPKAKAGNDIEIKEGAEGQLDGSASYDLNGNELSYAWSDLDGLGIIGPNTVNPSFKAPSITSDKLFQLVLLVNNGEKDSEPDTVNVFVKNIASGPVADAGADFELYETETGVLDGSASYDPDNLDMTYAWELIPNDIILTNPDSAVATFIAPEVSTNKNYLAVLTLTNSDMISNKDTVSFVVKNANKMPVAKAGSDTLVNEGTQVILNGGNSYDPDNAPNELGYNWIALNGGDIEYETNAEATFNTPWLLSDSVFLFALTVSDGDKYSLPDTVAISVKHKNLKPVANAGDDVVVDEGDEFVLDGSLSFDPEGETIFYEWSSDFLILDDIYSSAPYFIALEVQKDTTVFIGLRVKDAELYSEWDSIAVSIKQINKQPEWISITGDSAFIGKQYEANIEAFDADLLDSLTITATDLPTWLSFIDNGNGTARLFCDSVPRDASLLGEQIITLSLSDGLVKVDTTYQFFVSILTYINTQIATKQLLIYPNPASSFVTIDFGKVPQKNTVICLYDQQGRLLKEQAAGDMIEKLSLKEFSPGTYFVKTRGTLHNETAHKIILN